MIDRQRQRNLWGECLVLCEWIARREGSSESGAERAGTYKIGGDNSREGNVT